MKVKEEMKLFIKEILDANPLLTFEAINAKLRQRLPGHPAVHMLTVAKHLKEIL